MQLLDAGNQLPSRPTPNPTVSPGWANNDLTGDSPSTIADPDTINALMAEILSVLTAASITPSKGSVNQLLTAIQNGAGLPSLLSTNGYAKLPGGLILQWGTYVLPTGNGDVVTLPIAFPNNILHVTASDGGSGCRAFGWAKNGASLSSFLGYCIPPAGTSYGTGSMSYTIIGN